jgi:hypothetical protein
MNNYFFVANEEVTPQSFDPKMDHLYQQIETVETVLIIIVTIVFVVWFLRTLRDGK